MKNIPTQQSKERTISSYKIKLIKALHVSAEDRNEETKGNYPGGRFKRYIDVVKAFFQPLMTANLFTILFFIPIIAIFLIFELYGYENIAYFVNGVSSDNIPFFLEQYGIGVSKGMGINEGYALIFNSYRILIAGVGLFFPLTGLGIAGNMSICQKLIWGETLLMKKDKYGNDVPRITKEFFKGVKKYSGEVVLTMAIIGLICVGVGLMSLEFVKGVMLNEANALHYIGFIFSVLITLFSFFIINTYLPFIVSYNSQNFRDRLKNSIIITLSFPIQSVFIMIFAFSPLLLLLMGDMIKIIATIALLSFGVSHWSLVLVNYSDYVSELLIQPLYQQEVISQQRAERKKAKKASKTKQNHQKKKK